MNLFFLFSIQGQRQNFESNILSVKHYMISILSKAPGKKMLLTEVWRGVKEGLRNHKEELGLRKQKHLFTLISDNICKKGKLLVLENNPPSNIKHDDHLPKDQKTAYCWFDLKPTEQHMNSKKTKIKLKKKKASQESTMMSKASQSLSVLSARIGQEQSCVVII